MPPRPSLFPWILVFVVLDLYAHLAPLWVPQSDASWLLQALGFFVVAWTLGRRMLGVRGLGGFGLGMGPGWRWQLALGFGLGFAVWALKNVVFLAMGKFQVLGVMPSAYIGTLMLQALLGMLLASAINDLMIRGYWYAWCHRNGRLPWYLLIATTLYALDDCWNEGFVPLNLLFSAVLGLSLAWTVLKTGRIWMSIGIHWGGNVAFRAISGFDGQGALRLADVQQGTRYEWVAIAVTALLLPTVYWLLRDRAPAGVAAREPA